MDGNNHYIRLDANNFVIKAFSDAFEQPESTDILIAEDAGRHYNPILFDDRGNPIYKWDGTQMVDRTQNGDYLLAAAKAAKIAELTAMRDAAILADFQSDCLSPGVMKTYAYDPVAQDRFGKMLTRLTANPSITTVDWATKEDGVVSHTRDQFIQLATVDAYNHESIPTYHHLQLEAQVKAITLDTGGADAVYAITW